MKLNKETIKNFIECPVEIIDCNNKVNKGWLIQKDDIYKLLPFDTIWNVYVYKISHIKSIKHLTNNFQLRRC